MWKRPKHEPTDSYSYLERHLAKCMMRADDLKSDIHSVRTEITGMQQIPILHVCFADESKSKEFLVEKNLSKVCSIGEGE